MNVNTNLSAWNKTLISVFARRQDFRPLAFPSLTGVGQAWIGVGDAVASANRHEFLRADKQNCLANAPGGATAVASVAFDAAVLSTGVRQTPVGPAHPPLPRSDLLLTGESSVSLE